MSTIQTDTSSTASNTMADSTKQRGEKSSILKMISQVPEDRIISRFPVPYFSSISSTPYKQLDFSNQTKTVCENYKQIVHGLKICKLIILGDVCAGKTCMVNRFCHKVFDSNYKATIGVDFEVEKFEILGVPFNIQIWDTAGQERFKCIAQSYYRSAHVIVLVFDVSSIQTLYNCKVWLKEALDASTYEPFIFLVGTKKDLLCDATYQSVEPLALDFANSINAEYWSVSAKSGENIDKCFHRIAALAFDNCMLSAYESQKNDIKIGSELIAINKKVKKKHIAGHCTESKCSHK